MQEEAATVPSPDFHQQTHQNTALPKDMEELVWAEAHRPSSERRKRNQGQRTRQDRRPEVAETAAASAGGLR